MAKQAKCKNCGQIGHYQTFCFYQVHEPIKKESEKAKVKRIMTKRRWLKENPPDENGQWTCYLQISAYCLKKLTKYTLTLEHVEAKVRRQELKYNTKNIRPACSWCNKLKGSRSLAELAIDFPHVKQTINMLTNKKD